MGAGGDARSDREEGEERGGVCVTKKNQLAFS